MICRPNRTAQIPLYGVPTLSSRIANTLKEREQLTPEEEAIANAEIAEATQQLRERQVTAGKRSSAPQQEEEEFDDEA